MMQIEMRGGTEVSVDWGIAIEHTAVADSALAGPPPTAPAAVLLDPPTTVPIATQAEVVRAFREIGPGPELETRRAVEEMLGKQVPRDTRYRSACKEAFGKRQGGRPKS
jgi:hypothetical protein